MTARRKLKPTTEVERINAQGLGAGWHAERLKDDAVSLGLPMAVLFGRRVATAAAYAVPAFATRIKGDRVYYRFLDGSEAWFPYQKRTR